MLPDMSTAVIYCRISRDPDGTMLGVERQERDCRALCEQEGFDVRAVEVDDDVSAYRGKPRRAFGRVQELLRSGAVDALVVWHPDRLTRNPRELEDLIDLLDSSGVEVRTVQAGRYDLSTPAGRMTARVVGSVARYESEHKSARLKAKHLQLAERGALAGGGSRKFGYACKRADTSSCLTATCTHDGITVIEAEAAIIREVMQGFLAGRTITGIAHELNRRGILRTEGGRWNASQVRSLLSSAYIAGHREHEGNLTPAIWPAIVALDDVLRARVILSRPTVRRPSQSYLLRGLLRCSSCKTTLIARPRQDGRKCYVCPRPDEHNPGCGKRRVLGESVEQYVLDAVFARLDHADLPPVAEQSHEDDALARIARLDERLAQLGEMWAAGEIDRVGWQAARRRLDAERDALATEVAAAVRRKASARPAGPLRDVWDDLAFDRQHAIVAELIECIDLGPAVPGRNKFDPSRVSVVWRA